MLSARRILTPNNLRILSGRVAAYHTLHEQQATVLPNKVETASASFKVNPSLSLSFERRAPYTNRYDA